MGGEGYNRRRRHADITRVLQAQDRKIKNNVKKLIDDMVALMYDVDAKVDNLEKFVLYIKNKSNRNPKDFFPDFPLKTLYHALEDERFILEPLTLEDAKKDGRLIEKTIVSYKTYSNFLSQQLSLAQTIMNEIMSERSEVYKKINQAQKDFLTTLDSINIVENNISLIKTNVKTITGNVLLTENVVHKEVNKLSKQSIKMEDMNYSDLINLKKEHEQRLIGSKEIYEVYMKKCHEVITEANKMIKDYEINN